MRNLNWIKIIFVGMLLSTNVLAKPAAVPEPPVYTQDKPIAVVTEAQPEFVIKLKSNPTTGYSWFLRGYNSEILLPINHLYQAPDTKLVGAPGFELWTFKVKPVGFLVPQQTVIKFIYSRPWEAADTATQLNFKVTTAQGSSKK